MLFVPSGLLVSRSFSFFRPGSCSCDLRGCHQPRIEPWLTQSTTLACRSLNSMELPPVAEKLMRIKRQNPAAKPVESGLDLEKQISTPVEAELFFLTSPFIELIERRPGSMHYEGASCFTRLR